MKASLAQEGKMVVALPPAADSAGRTAAKAFSLKNTGRVGILVYLDQQTATPPAITVFQSTDVAKTGGKALTNPAKIWSNLVANTTDLLVQRPDAASYTPDVGVAQKIVYIEVDADSLDVENGFDCVYVSTGASAAGNTSAAMYIATDARYQSSAQPSASID